MKIGMMRKIAVLVTGSALAVSFPVASSVADQGGEPNHGKAKTEKKQKKNQNDGNCSDKARENGTGVDQNRLPTQAQWSSGEGLKCGFFKFGLTAAP